tara:strand:- start:4044 stop:6488 length:2445 start_codon:yes stop_codon:yes gene_type:complete
MAIEKQSLSLVSNPEEEMLTVEIPDDSPMIPEGIEIEGMPEESILEIVPDEGESFYENLAEIFEERDLRNIGLDLLSDFEEDESSREEWLDTFVKGLELLGIKTTDRSQPFPGASGVHHPLLSESVAQFQAQAYKELLPADGPIKTQLVGVETDEKVQQAERVQEFMNYQLTYNMEEYDPELDQMLFYLPLSGSAFKKVYYDPAKQRAVSSFVMAEDFIVSYTTQDLMSCERATHSITMTENQIRKLQLAGLYADIEIGSPATMYENDTAGVKAKIDELSGVVKPNSSDTYTVLEMHVDLDLEGFEDIGEDGEETGIALPYIVTIIKENANVLSIRRNYSPDDPLKEKIQYFVHYKFLPGLGFYGFGLIHMIGGLTKSATSILRQLIDAGTLANLPAGFKARGLRIRDDDQPIQPGEWRDVDAPGGALRDSLMPLPYKEPSNVLAQLLGVLVESGQRFANIADMKIGDMGQEAPVGTTIAMLERGSKIMSAIHKRLHYGQKMEFKLLARVFSEYLPPEYPYDVVGGSRIIFATDFDAKVDVIPVSDPNIFSMSQRIMMAQTQLQLAQSAPELHNLREAYRKMYTALGVQEIDKILEPEMQSTPKDPIKENEDSLMGESLKAFIEQNHDAHIQAHMAFMQNPMVQQNPQAIAALQAHIQEHQAMKYRVQIEQILAQQGIQLPPEGQEIPVDIQNQIAVMAAQATQQITGQEQALIEAQQIAEQQPQIELAQQQLALQEADIQRKSESDQLRSQTDLAKAQLSAQTELAKADKTEDIAQQRIAANREKDAIDAQLKSQKQYGDILKQVKDAEKESE